VPLGGVATPLAGSRRRDRGRLRTLCCCLRQARSPRPAGTSPGAPTGVVHGHPQLVAGVTSPACAYRGRRRRRQPAGVRD